MKRFWPLAFILFGIIILFAGYLYDVLFAGIPYPDPTPALEASYEFHARIASILYWVGLGVCTVGGVSIIIRKLQKTAHR